MLRPAATAALLLVAAGFLAACGAADEEAATTTVRDGAGTTMSRMRKDDLRRAGATFTLKAVRACVQRAKTSFGTVTTTSDPYLGALTAPDGILEFGLVQTDIIMPGVTIGFAGDHLARVQFAKTALAWESERVGRDYGRALVFRQRGNAVFYYEKVIGTEVVRIAQGCLGGPPYAGDGGEPSSGEWWWPPHPPGAGPSAG